MMQRYGRFKSLVWILTTALLAVPASLRLAHAGEVELEEIRAAIQSKTAQWVAGENEISQLPAEERNRRLGAKIDPKEFSASPDPRFKALAAPEVGGLPTKFDWRSNGGNFVTPVRDQGSCGSCWAFATTAALESKALIYFNRPGATTNFSEQIVLSCTPPHSDGSNNCDGGYAMMRRPSW